MGDGGKGDKRRPGDDKAFDDGYGRIFGNNKPKRGKFIWDASIKEFIPFSEYVMPETGIAPMIMPDIKPYRSQITGEEIGSRSTHRNHLRSHGCIEIGNEKMQERKPMTAPRGLKDELIGVANSKLRY